MMFFDPQYFLFVVPGLLLSMFAAWYVRSTFRRYSQVPLARGLTGAQAAEAVLRGAGVYDVRIEATSGFLSDHYDPREKVLRLSADVYGGRSVAAAGVAAHEAGHAIQHARGYGLMTVRQALVMPARIGSQLSFFVIVIGLALHAMGVAWFGVLLFSAIFLFELVTLPVEVNASTRARQRLESAGLVTAQDAEGVHRVLRAAALTYVAALVSTALQLLYFITRIRQEER
ncbi:MAG TPA: zinc metallopeptidase [Polyangia bacterium]|nr:zinc metallopeptidase [Polyangia bacterium]